MLASGGGVSLYFGSASGLPSSPAWVPSPTFPSVQSVDAEGDTNGDGFVQPSEVNPLLQEVLRRVPAADLTVEEPPLEDVLTRAFGATREAAS